MGKTRFSEKHIVYLFLIIFFFIMFQPLIVVIIICIVIILLYSLIGSDKKIEIENNIYY